MYKKAIQFLSKHKAVVFLLFLGLMLRLAYFLIVINNFGSEGFYLSSNGDAIEYLAMAKEWLFSGTYNSMHGSGGAEIFRMPGYPILIAFFYKIMPNVALTVLFQNLVFVATAGLFYRFVLFLFKNKMVALVSLGLLMLEPSIIYWNNQLITETLFAVLIFLCVYSSFIFYKIKALHYPSLTGLFLALAIFIRPAGEYLTIAFIVFYLAILISKIISFKKFVLALLLFLIAFLVPLSPWMAQNKDNLGYYAISDASTVGFGKYVTAIAEQTGGEVEIYELGNTFDNAKLVRGKAIKSVSEHPFVFSKIYLLSLVPFLFGDSYLSVFGMIFPDLEKQRVITDWRGGGLELFSFFRGHKGMEAVVYFGGKIIWFVIAILAFMGFFYWLRKIKEHLPILLLIFLLIGYFSLASGIGSYSRFRFPVVMFIFLFTSLGIHWLLKLRKKKV